MALKAGSLSEIYKRFKPHLLMVIFQIVVTSLYFITEASFNHGVNPHVYITYRHIVAGIFLFPFAYILERKQRPKLALSLFVQIFIVSLFAVGLSLNMYFESMRYTSPTFIVSVTNTISTVTFVIAIVLRLEIVHLRNARSMAKVLGTLLSLAGVTTMALYKGPVLRNLWRPLIHTHRNNTIREKWMKGSIPAVACCISLSMAYILQAMILKRYPARLSLPTWMCFLGGAQSAFFTVIVDHKSVSWRIGFDIDLWSTLYCGIMISGLYIFIQLWCTEQRGPVFVTVFSPISTILVEILSYFVFGEKLYMGSIIGAVIVTVGLYTLLCGKEGDMRAHINAGEQSYQTYSETTERTENHFSSKTYTTRGAIKEKLYLKN